MTKTFIIAEAGVNHNGSLELAYKLVDAALEAGADAVKFQTYKTENLVTKTAKQAKYQEKNIGKATSQFDMLKNLELSYTDFRKLNTYCEKRGIKFLSTPFDLESIDFLIQELGLDLIKIPSGEITNAPYLHKIASYGVNMILSTGMATVKEIHYALAFIAYGLAKKPEIKLDKVYEFYSTDKAKELLKEKVRILHCTTEYPTPYDEINLNAMDLMRKEFDLEVGFSDHSEGIAVSIAAVAKNASIIEKHFTLDNNMSGPDHKASLNPSELKVMIQSIRVIEKALGSDIKEPTQSEIKNKSVARKSLVAAKIIKKGELFSTENLTVKRPGTGIEPFYYWDYIGKTATKNYEEDEVIQHEC